MQRLSTTPERRTSIEISNILENGLIEEGTTTAREINIVEDRPLEEEVTTSRRCVLPILSSKQQKNQSKNPKNYKPGGPNMI